MPRCRSKELIEPDVAHTSSFSGDAAISGFLQAERAETTDADSSPAASDHVVDGPHSFAAPDDSVHFRGVLREVGLDLAREVAAVVWMVKTSAGRTPPVHVDLRHVCQAGNVLHHLWKCVVIVPREEVHSSSFHLWSYRGNDIKIRQVTGAEVGKRCIAEVLQIVVVEGSSDPGRPRAVLAVIGQGLYPSLDDLGRVVVVGIGENR